VVDQILTGVLDEIVCALGAGDVVVIRGFGRFERRERPGGQVYVNPITKATQVMPTQHRVAFVPSPKIKERLAGDVGGS
jgi:nucleoid DNA-binding protein